MSINIRRLKAFMAVAEHRSVTAAARRLHMTPPAVTKSLRELETSLTVELFQRTSSGMILTPAGEAFLMHASRALHEIERGREAVSNLIGGEGGRIMVGATVEAAILVLPRALGRLIERRPRIQACLAGGTYETLARELRSGSLDFFLGVVPDEGAGSDLACEPLFTDALHFVARPGHPLAARGDLSLADLMGQRWVLSTRDGPLTRQLRRSVEQAGLPFPADPVIVEPLSSLRGVLQNTDLVAAVTHVRLREEVDLGQLVALPVALPGTQHVVSIVKRDEPYQSAWSKQLAQLLHESARTLGLSPT